MFILGLALTAVAIGLAIVRKSPEAQNGSGQGWIVKFLTAFVLASVGVYLTRVAPYVAIIGAALFFISCLKWFDTPAFAKAGRAGLLLLVSSVLAIVLGLFPSPWDGGRKEEDRAEWKPNPSEIERPSELLNREWSTTDEYADWPVARLMLDLCKIAYVDPVDAREMLGKMGFESETINSGSMNGYVLSANGTAVIILRGTESNAYDVVQDLRFLKRTNNNGSMHGGFADGYDGMHGQVNKVLRRFDAKRVWITGHSLGGALSIVCAARLLEDDEFPIAGVMTFGQPKVVRDDMRQYLEPKLRTRYVFFVNDMDPVTRVIDPYMHFGHMVRFVDGRIIRSEQAQAVYGSKLGTTASASPYTEPMSDDKLDELLNELEGTAEPVTDENGKPVVQGYFPNIFDHPLDSYSAMIDSLIDGE